MTKVFQHSTFKLLVDETFREINKLSELKGGEYAGDEDRLANFRRNGQRLGLRMEAVWGVYAGKHWDAISQYIMDINTGRTRFRSESLSGRCDDLILYLLLFKAMLAESEADAE